MSQDNFSTSNCQRVSTATGPRLAIDRAQAECHLAALDRPGIPFIFMIAPEASGATGSVRHLCGTLFELADQFDLAQRAGCGVFVTINAMIGRRRLKADVARIRALWCERDQRGHPLPLRPSLRIRTSPGRGHDYMLADPDDAPAPAEAERINKMIADDYGGDRNACDLARVLRLTGSWHLKGAPFRVEIIGGTGGTYDRASLLAAFPAPPPPPRPAGRAPTVHVGDRYIAAAIRGVAEELAEAQPGCRNAELNASAFRLAQLGLGVDRITAILGPIATTIGLAAGETARTIRSGASAGAAHPRGRSAA